MRLSGRIVTPDGVIDDGEVTIEDGRIAAVAPASPASPASPVSPVSSASPVSPVSERTGWILPGFVDLHVHGGGGHTFTTGDPDSARAAARFHGRHGTTTLLASLVSSPYQLMRDATVAFGPLIEQGVLAGLHYEGPYLSPKRCGAQNPAYLRDPNQAELSTLVALGGVRMVTIAPELPGALDTIEYLRRHDVIVAIGHTDASYEQTRAAIAAGATVGTHVCNGMRPVHHREPGPVIALLDAPGVICEQVADGHHLHDGMLRHVIGSAGPGRVALITDAMDAAGMPDGDYDLGGQAVVVTDGVARLARGGAIAGSTLTMDAAVRRAVHSGVNIVDVARMAAATPARALGLAAEIGTIEVGKRADLVLLDDVLAVTGVLRAGEPYPD